MTEMSRSQCRRTFPVPTARARPRRGRGGATLTMRLLCLAAAFGAGCTPPGPWVEGGELAMGDEVICPDPHEAWPGRLVEVTAERGVELDYDAAREAVYGMTYGEWKENHQTETTPEKLEKFKAESDKHAF